MGFTDRLQHAWNALTSRDPTYYKQYYYERGSSYRPDRTRLSITNERSIIGSIYNRISIDVMSMPIRHVRIDDNDRYVGLIDSGLNNALSLSANIDQTGRAFIQDAVMSLCDEGSIALVPVDTTGDPDLSDSYDILTLRVGKIKEWYPTKVKVDLYNDRTGLHEEIDLPKSYVAIIENPLYAVMNEPNSTLKRLSIKLSQQDAIDQQMGSNKLDLIIQLPYVVRSEAKRAEANKRRKDIEDQLSGAKYGVAYTDGTEKVTQLNRPVENSLMEQIQFLTSMLYSQLGITEEVLNGTADEKTMLNYYNRSVKPMLDAITEGMMRTFLTKTAYKQKQRIKYFRDPFSLVPINQLADIADKFTRNEILTSNEMRDIIGVKPSDDPEADKLRNKNLNKPTDNSTPDTSQNGGGSGGVS